jgi:hypothetical protein
MPHFKTLWRSTISAVLLALLSATAQADTTRQEFDAALQKWQAAGIHDYAFTLVQHCFCIGVQPVRITVKNDIVQSARNVQGDATVAAEVLGNLPSIEVVFQKIAEGYAKPVDHITLTLNKDFGYPERVFIDYYVLMADEELIYEIRDFSH